MMTFTDLDITDILAAGMVKLRITNSDVSLFKIKSKCVNFNSENKSILNGTKPVFTDNENNLYIFQCPHCDAYIEVEKNQVNCTIFRHAYYYTKDPRGNIILTGQLNPHAPREECDRLFSEGKILGCGKPFRMIQKGNGYIAQICDYI